VRDRCRWLLVLGLLAPVPAVAQQEGEARTSRGPADTHEDGQPARLASLPDGMTLDMIVQGDSLFRGKGGCVTCHGQEANGMPNGGSSLTGGLHFIPPEWKTIDAVILAGVPEPVTRSSVAMPPRGAKSDLTPEESRLIAAYVWAISQTKGEPWRGGHKTHGQEQQARAE
jgi:mono/diheme cytochrome c family protein